MSDGGRARRRWLTLAELVAVVGAVIAGLTLWNSWQDRRDARAERAAEHQAASDAGEAERRHVGLIAAGKGGDTLAVKARDCDLQSFDVSFPTALGIAPQRMVVDHLLSAEWVTRPLLALTAGKDETRGRMPVLIESRCEAASGDRDETAVYVLVWQSHGRLLRGHVVDLVGIAGRTPVKDAAAGQQRVDAAWAADKPA